MSNHWIKVRVRLFDDPAVLALSDTLSISPETTVGHLVRLWGWATDHLIDGNAAGVTATQLDRIAGIKGFADQLIQVGWLERTEDGLQFPKWAEHLSQGAKERALVTKRVERHRDKLKLSGNAEPVTDQLPEKRREEKSKTVIQGNDLLLMQPQPQPKKVAVGSDQFVTGWAAVNGPVSPELAEALRSFWEHRKQMRKPITPASVTFLARECAGFAEADVIADIRKAVASGYQGLRPRKSFSQQMSSSTTLASRLKQSRQNGGT
jgi:hypothetical protein